MTTNLMRINIAFEEEKNWKKRRDCEDCAITDWAGSGVENISHVTCTICHLFTSKDFTVCMRMCVSAYGMDEHR